MASTSAYITGSGREITIVENYSAIPPSADVPDSFWLVKNKEGTWWRPGSSGGTYRAAGLYYSDGVTTKTTPVPYQATLVEVKAGVVTDRFVAPDTLKVVTDELRDYIYAVSILLP
jgi:hypothetical protein